jgi:predicted hotdog family 3-hydroxylacyl-ACP dehydratase
MKIAKTDIGSFIPQRPPFIMIDNLVHARADYFESDFFISPDNIFVENGRLREFGLIENIAQSCSAGIAFTNAHLQKKNIEGFIGAISKLKLFALPGENETIQTRIQLIAQLDNLYMLKGETFLNETKLLECELKLAGQ